MKFFKCFLLFFYLLLISSCRIKDKNSWKANWIWEPTLQSTPNSWFCFRKDFSLDNVPAKALAKIAADSKYWLWVNGELVIFEGGLKRGPNPNDTYFDEIDLSKFLQRGKNSISILTWYFGVDGLSHVNSGKAGLLFECIAPGIEILSDHSWKVMQHPAYTTCTYPLPNFRLSESSIRFDSRFKIGKWQHPDFNVSQWANASESGIAPIEPWNNLVERPIPQWKNSGLKNYTDSIKFPIETLRDTIITCTLPANIQITPYLKIDAPAGLTIDIRTDDFNGGGSPNVRAEYITSKDIQEYESYGWMNGHKVIYTIPKGIKILSLKYRETGFDTEFAGDFKCPDEFLNRLWEKSRRTLYVNMRDNYMDCPDRERAQWLGDAVIEGGEAFYALDLKSHSLFRKGMYELIGWQRDDDILFSPIPTKIWDKELPCQILSGIGYYGFWNYYLHTADKQAISDLYPAIKKYLLLWKINALGTIEPRNGDIDWADWGEEIDSKLIQNEWYYLAIKGACNMAKALGKSEDAIEYDQLMMQQKSAFNKCYWNGSSYRDPAYKGKTDDRSQALAVVSGLADKEKYPALFTVLKNEEHASPYMEKYVLEALFLMNHGEYAVERMKKRFGKMVNNQNYTTLFEGWNSTESSNETTNHGWSGGGLIILLQYLCGIAPLEPGYSTFEIIPQPAGIEKASAKIQSVKGEIRSDFINKPDKFELSVVIPKGTEAIVAIPDKNFSVVETDGKEIWRKGKNITTKKELKFIGISNGYIKYRVASGSWHFIASK